MIEVADHPLLELYAFVTEFDRPLGEIPAPEELLVLMQPGAAAPVQASDADRLAIRNLLRQDGFKPTGRSKPAPEYLLKAQAEGKLYGINLAVDACNVVSLHSGLPVSVVDFDRAQAPWRVAIAEPGASYVFNSSGQWIDIGGLLCLFDANGPCANAVKDSQRTKTGDVTRRTLSLIWGTKAIPGRCQRVAEWYHDLLRKQGVKVEIVGTKHC